jgi:hypothetical protein
LGDARYISVDSSRSRAELSWLPQIDLRHGEDVAGTSGPSELKEKLEATRAASASRVPADKRAIMERATADLRASGILKNVAAVGQVAPAFTAPDYDGRVLSSHELLARGPLVISFFRGAW